MRKRIISIVLTVIMLLTALVPAMSFLASAAPVATAINRIVYNFTAAGVTAPRSVQFGEAGTAALTGDGPFTITRTISGNNTSSVQNFGWVHNNAGEANTINGTAITLTLNSITVRQTQGGEEHTLFPVGWNAVFSTSNRDMPNIWNSLGGDKPFISEDGLKYFERASNLQFFIAPPPVVLTPAEEAANFKEENAAALALTVETVTIANRRLVNDTLNLFNALSEEVKAILNSDGINAAFFAALLDKIDELIANLPPVDFLTSMDYAAAMGIGWNLGNTFDSTGNTVAGWETAWNNPRVTRELIADIKAKGFDHIRMPFTVGSGDGANNRVRDNGAATPAGQIRYQINQQGLDRYREVVEWAVEEGLYVMINLHHDSWQWLEAWDGTTTGTNAQALRYRRFCDYWVQLAALFADMPHEVMFETINEPQFGGTSTQRQNRLNLVNQAAYDIIRATPGNENRMVIIPTYNTNHSESANDPWTPSTSAWIRAQQDPYIIATVHFYSEWVFSQHLGGWGYDEQVFNGIWDEGDLRTPRSLTYELFDIINRHFLQHNIGVSIGEWGLLAYDRENTGANMLQRGEELKYYAHFNEMAKAHGVSLSFWDNGSGILRGSAGFPWRVPRMGEVLLAGARGEKSSTSVGIDTLYFRNAPAVDISFKLDLKGNTLTGIQGLTRGVDYTFDAATATVTLKKEFVEARFNTLGADAFGQFAELILEFNEGANWHQFLVKNGTPTINTSSGTRGANFNIGGNWRGNRVVTVSATRLATAPENAKTGNPENMRVGGNHGWWPHLEWWGTYQLNQAANQITLRSGNSGEGFWRSAGGSSLPVGNIILMVDFLDGTRANVTINVAGTATTAAVSVTGVTYGTPAMAADQFIAANQTALALTAGSVQISDKAAIEAAQTAFNALNANAQWVATVDGFGAEFYAGLLAAIDTLEAQEAAAAFRVTHAVIIAKATASYMPVDKALVFAMRDDYNALSAEARSILGAAGGNPVINAAFINTRVTAANNIVMNTNRSLDYAQAMGMGWNLGNTFDGFNNKSLTAAACDTCADCIMGGGMTAWGNPIVTKELIEYIASMGFGHIRLPMTADMRFREDSRGDATPVDEYRYIFDESWLASYREVTQWSLDAGMYVMLNMHHDSWRWINWWNGTEAMTGNDQNVQSEGAEITRGINVYRLYVELWKQLNEYFADMPDQVMFETINEPQFRSGGGAPSAQVRLDRLNSVSQQITRSIPGNETRMLILPTMNTNHGASNNQTLRDLIATLRVDGVQDEHIIATVHFYHGDWTFSANLGAMRYTGGLLTGNNSPSGLFSLMDTHFLTRGIGINIGEWGLLAHDEGWPDYIGHLQQGEELKYLEDVIHRAATRYGANLTYWDNGWGVYRWDNREDDGARRVDFEWRAPLARVGEMLKSGNKVPFERTSYSTGIDTIYHRTAPTGNVSIPLTLNGNTFVGIAGLVEGEHFTLNAARNNVTLLNDFVVSEFNKMDPDEFGVYKKLVLQFSGGLDWNMFLVKNGAPTFGATLGTRDTGIRIPVDLRGNMVERVRAFSGTSGTNRIGDHTWAPGLIWSHYRVDYANNEFVLERWFTGHSSVAAGNFRIEILYFDGTTQTITLNAQGSASSNGVVTFAAATMSPAEEAARFMKDHASVLGLTRDIVTIADRAALQRVQNIFNILRESVQELLADLGVDTDFFENLYLYIDCLERGEHLFTITTGATDAKYISIIETFKLSRIWELTFSVTAFLQCEHCDAAGSDTVIYSVLLNGNNANLDGEYTFPEDHDLAGLTLTYDIKGNGSNIKEFVIR